MGGVERIERRRIGRPAPLHLIASRFGASMFPNARGVVYDVDAGSAGVGSRLTDGLVRPRKRVADDES